MKLVSNRSCFYFQNITVAELDRLLGIVVDVENLFMCVHKEEDADTKQVPYNSKNRYLKLLISYLKTPKTGTLQLLKARSLDKIK